MDTFRFIVGNTPTVLLLILLRILMKNSIFREFPWFFAYVLFTTLASILRFLFRNISNPFFYIYWVTEAGCLIHGIMALYEVFRTTFLDPTIRRTNPAKVWWIRMSFPCIVCFV